MITRNNELEGNGTVPPPRQVPFSRVACETTTHPNECSKKVRHLEFHRACYRSTNLAKGKTSNCQAAYIGVAKSIMAFDQVTMFLLTLMLFSKNFFQPVRLSPATHLSASKGL